METGTEGDVQGASSPSAATRRRVTLCVPNVARRPDNTNRLYTLGLLYLHAAVVRAGWDCSLVDAYFRELDTESTVRAILADGAPQVLGFTLNSEEMCIRAMAIVRALFDAGTKPFVVVGGYYATLQKTTLLARHAEIDWLVSGEGDLVLPELLRQVETAERYPIEGVYARNIPLGRTRRQAVVTNLDTLGPLNWAAADELPGADEWSLVTSRGCTAACSYCPVGALWGKYGEWRGHSARWIHEQMTELARRGATHVQFVDDQFVGSPESIVRAWELVALLETNTDKLPFYIMARADTVSSERCLFEALARAGLRTVFVGLESASQEALNVWRKETTLAQAEEAVALLDSLGVVSAAGTIVFRPDMTRASIREDIAFLARLLSHYPHFIFYGLNELDILEGTPIARRYGDFTWMHPWRAQDPSVDAIYRRWLRIQREVLFPAIRLLSIRRDLRVRRAVCDWQLETLGMLVDLSETGGSPSIGSLVESMARLVLRVEGGLAAANYLMGRGRTGAMSSDHVPASERCFE